MEFRILGSDGGRAGGRRPAGRDVAASDGTRTSVTAAMRRARVRDGLLGTFSFDAAGDMTLKRIFIHRIRRGELIYVRTVTSSNGLPDG